MSFLLAFVLSAGIAIAGWLAGALTARGAVAATAVGTAILAGAGWTGMAALGAFFIGASIISRVAPDRTARFDSKGDRRDALQVLANGGAAAVGAWVPGAGAWIVTASLAAAAADTWATSTGGWSRIDPRHILNFRPVPPGASGGITWRGSLGAAVGAAVVGLPAAIVSGEPLLLPLGLGIGMTGMLTDSVLGASLQGRFHCDACNQPTERTLHRCGRPSRLTGGFPWLSNDGVNALATTLAAVAGFAAWSCWHG